jgi:protein-arginine kinase activator protein McsA
MICQHCESAPGTDAYVVFDELERGRQAGVPLCQECYDSLRQTTGISVARTHQINRSRPE